MLSKILILVCLLKKNPSKKNPFYSDNIHFYNYSTHIGTCMTLLIDTS